VGSSLSQKHLVFLHIKNATPQKRPWTGMLKLLVSSAAVIRVVTQRFSPIRAVKETLKTAGQCELRLSEFQKQGSFV